MDVLNDFLTVSIRIIFVVIALLSLLEYLRDRKPVRRDTALLFASIAIVILLQIVDEINRLNLPQEVLNVLGLTALVTQPYFMLRVATHFRPIPKNVQTSVFLGMVISELIVVLYPTDMPLILTAIAGLYFVIANSYAMVVFIQNARIASGILQKRMRFTALGAGLLALTFFFIIIGSIIPSLSPITSILAQFATVGSALTYYLGLTTPRWLRQTWQFQELQNFLSRLTQKEIPATRTDVYDFLVDWTIETISATQALIAIHDDAIDNWSLHRSGLPPTTCILGDDSLIEDHWRKNALAAVQVRNLGATEYDCLQPKNADLIYIVPLQISDQTSGILLVLIEHGHLFVDDDLSLLALCKQQCEIILENINLVGELKRYSGELEEIVIKRTANLIERTTHIRLLQQITLAANEARGMEDSLQQSIQIICDALNFPIGHVFAPQAASPFSIVSTSIWHLDSPTKYEALRKMTESMTFDQHFGGIGPAFIEAKPQWIPNITKRSDFVRAEVAKEAGIQTGIFLPIIIVDKTVAILEFFSNKLIEPDKDLLDILTQIGGLLGRVIERQQTELKIRQSEARFSALTQFAPLGIVIINREGDIIVANKKLNEMFGYEPSELPGNKLEMLLPKRLESIHHEHRQEFLSEPKARTMGVGLDLVGRRKDGTEFPIEVGLSHIESHEGLLMVGFVSDITEQKRATEALLESEQKYHRILDNMLEGFQIIGFDWEVLYLNQAASDFGRKSREELLGSTVMAEYLGIEATDMFAAMQACMDERSTFVGEFEFAYPDGSVAWFKFSIQPVPEGISVLTIDITQRKQAEMEMRYLNQALEQRVKDRTAHLEAVNKELEAFSYSVSHDLRAPLRALDGFSLALLEDYHAILDENGQQFLNVIRKESQQMGQLIDDLIGLSRIARVTLEIQPTNLSQIAHDIRAQLQAQEPERDVTFLIEDNIVANASPSLMQVVLQNLIYNAWKFTSQNPQAQIEFGSTRAEGVVEYYVRDNGAGFDMAYVDKLFGAFNRLHARDEFEGTGIGLATVQRIIHRHNGTIRAEGVVNQGATFYFTLDSIRS